MMCINTVGYADDSLYAKALEIAEPLNLKVDKYAQSCLWVTADKLGLKYSGFQPVFADFNLHALNKRISEGKKQGLVKACRPSLGVKIVDATAGWGKDAAILAGLGAQVTMLERHPVMAALLQDALMQRDSESMQKMHLSLICSDAITYLTHLDKADYPDVIYIDPMHPVRNKSALVKKEMQVLQHLIGEDLDAKLLIELALTKARNKVVVKWPQKIKPLIPACAGINGKTIRFDIYSTKS